VHTLFESSEFFLSYFTLVWSFFQCWWIQQI